MYARFNNPEIPEEGFKVYHKLPETWRRVRDNRLMLNFRNGATTEQLTEEGFLLVEKDELAVDYKYGGVIWDNVNQRFVLEQRYKYADITLDDYKKNRTKEILSEIDNLMAEAKEVVETMNDDPTAGFNATKATALLSTARNKRKAFLNLMKNATDYNDVNRAMQTAHTQLDAIERYSIIDDFLGISKK